MHKLKITNIPRWISEIHLKQFFNHCGKIVQANVALDPHTLRPLGFGYITFADAEATELALEKNNALLDGVAIKVQLAEEADLVTDAISV